MTHSSQPLPAAGGSFIREKDGTLVPRPADPEPAQQEPEPLAGKPAAKGIKLPVKET